MAELEIVDRELEQLLANISPAERRKLATSMARDLRRSQAERIAAQRNPDGSAFAPRKPSELRTRSGQIKRKASARTMFRKLRQARYLRAEADADELRVGYVNAIVARVARVHQHGLRDRVSRRPGAPEVTYAERRLLGFTEADRAYVLERAYEQLARR